MMTQDCPTISIIIPTHNRQASLRRLLDSLQVQTYPLEEMEVIVIADGCSDETHEMLQSYPAPFALHFIEQSKQGAGAARNQGAAMAKGHFLLFLDDDIDPSPHLVEAHVHAHRQEDQVVIGYLPLLSGNQASFFHIQLRAWWEEKFQTMRKKGHRYTYEDLLSGNFSVTAELFKRVDGFDVTFRHREDYELGVRLIKAGANFTLAMNASGYHRDEVTDLDRSLRRKRHEGAADVLFGRRHPDVMHKLRLFQLGNQATGLNRLVIFLAFAGPGISDLIARQLRRLHGVMEGLRMYGSWRGLNNRLHSYWYLRGVVDELRTRRSLISYLQGGLIGPSESVNEIEVDLQQGLAAVEQQLDEIRPAGVRIRYGDQALGRILPEAGSEPLRGIHLRPVLATSLAWPLMRAMMLNNAPKNNALLNRPPFG